MSTLSLPTLEFAERVFARHRAERTLYYYTGILSLHGAATVATAYSAPAARARLLGVLAELFSPFLQGQVAFPANFTNYHCGGNGAAYLWWKGLLPGASQSVFQPYIDQLLHSAPRDRNGALCHPEDPDNERIWIDTAFAVSPFLLYCGLALSREDLVTRAWEESRLLIEPLRVPETGLVNQAINYRWKGQRTTDHWSRGNGWAIHALAALAADMPNDHPSRQAADAAFVDLCAACLRTQDPVSGLWHQEMTAPESYLETSGSGLILHAFGVGVRKGLLEEQYREAFHKGMQGLMAYVRADGSVLNTCISCCAPGDGSRETYIRHPHARNDDHSFGPVIFALAEAALHGISTVEVPIESQEAIAA